MSATNLRGRHSSLLLLPSPNGSIIIKLAYLYLPRILMSYFAKKQPHIGAAGQQLAFTLAYLPLQAYQN